MTENFKRIMSGLNEVASIVEGSSRPLTPNTAENLRQLLLEIYVSASIRRDLPDFEWDRVNTIILDAAEGRPFEPLVLPFPPL